MQKKQRTNIVTKGLLTALLFILAISLVACGSKPADQGTSPSPSLQPSASTNVQPDSSASPDSSSDAMETVYPLTLKDDSGVEVTFEQAPERVVTIAPSETEVIFAIGGGDKVVAVDNYSNYPEEAATREKIGDMTLNVEAIIAAKPDLILAGGLNGASIEQLRNLDLTVFVSDPRSYDEVAVRVEQTGQIMNLQQEAKAVADQMRAVKEDVLAAVKAAEKSLVMIEYSPGFTVGDGEFMSELVEIAGGENVVAGQTGWIQFDPEAIIQADPQVIVYNVSEYYSIVDEMKQRPGWDQITAMKEDRVVGVNEDIVSRPGPRLADALQAIAKAIHPELVK